MSRAASRKAGGVGRRVLLVVALVAGGFAYGFLSHRQHWFPYGYLVAARQAAVSSPTPGVVEEPAEELGQARWGPAPGAGVPAGVEALESLGYLRGVDVAPDAAGVTLHDPGRAFQGVNLYTSGHGTEAILMDMDGDVLHRWSRAYGRIWREPPPEEAGDPGYWERAVLLPGGALLATFDDLGLVKLDHDSRLVWARRMRIHHDLEVADDGAIVTLTREVTRHPDLRDGEQVLEDFVTFLGPDGMVVRRISVLDAFRRAGHVGVLDRIEDHWDLFHANSVEILDGRLAPVHPAFQAGNLLLSLRHTNTIAVLDPQAEEIVWSLADLWRGQHRPTVLDRGTILLFDNLGAGEWSRVVEVDPARRQIVWSWEGTPERRFFTRYHGVAYRQPNGNTLVTESDRGRAFEITPQGETVWEFLNPERAGDDDELIAVIVDLVRLGPETSLDWLDAAPR